MKYKYSFDPIAAYEYEEAYKWYYAVSDSVAERFIQSVENGIKLVCSDPYRFRNTYKNLREISLKKYPYYLIYQVDEASKTIVITSVFHQKRNPKRKYRKKK